jgi:hypothetical protein
VLISGSDQEFLFPKVAPRTSYSILRRTKLVDKGKTIVPRSRPSKADLQDRIESAIAILQEAYASAASRDDLAAAVSDALDILNLEDNPADARDDTD